MSVISYNVFSPSKFKNTLSGRKAMLLEDNVLLKKKIPEKILLNKLSP